MPCRLRAVRAMTYTTIARTYIAPMNTSDDLLLTKYRPLENHSYRSNPSRPIVMTPATGTICTPKILTLLATDARHRPGLRHGRITTAIALNRYVTAMTSVASRV